MNFGERLKEYRERAGFDRVAFGDKIGVGASSVSNYENGLNFPNLPIIFRICDTLAIDMNTLFQDYLPADTFLCSAQEQFLIEKYRSLSVTGRQVAYSVVNGLYDVQQEIEERAAIVEEEAPQIPLYFSPAAAGYAAPVFGEDFDYISVDSSVPRGAAFAVRIQGDSMEPVIRNEAVVYVNREPLQNGDVGIFCVDGEMFCKQYYKASIGAVYLYSLNRRRADADIVLMPSSGRSLTCWGRVMLSRSCPLPHE